MSKRRWRVAGISFDHMHMGDLLGMVAEHPDADIVGIADPSRERMERVRAKLGIPETQVFTDADACLSQTKPDIVILCSSTGTHAEWAERIAPHGVHLLLEKPFASSVAEADRIIAAQERAGKRLAINWPLRWYPSHVTTKRLIDEGLIGEVTEVHYYDGNRGPLYHVEGKDSRVPTDEDKRSSWFYSAAAGGGSLLDYLGYGVTLGSWFNGGAEPLEVSALTWAAEGLEVDEHSITTLKYARGLSKFETRWGTFTDPWTHQPQPKCGFVICGTQGTIASYDYEPSIRIQTLAEPAGRQHPVDELVAPHANPIQYFLDCLDKDLPVDGPLSPETARLGQRIVDAALLSARTKRVVRLAEIASS
jgi:predicted dehydrogenase